MSIKETLTINKALAELKNINNELSNNRSFEKPYVGVLAGDSRIPTNRQYKKEEDLDKALRGNYQSVKTLMNRRDAIKFGLLRLNATTTVELNGKAHTLQEAIYIKQSVGAKETLLTQLKQSRSLAVSELNKMETEVNNKITELTKTATEKNPDVSKETLQKQAEFQRSQFAGELCDPLKINDLIENLEKEIKEIKLELNHKLTDINAVTTFEIEYQTA